MDLRIFTEPQQGASHADLLAVAQATRDGGFSAFFRSDHVLSMGDRSGLPGPSESFVNLGAIAAQVPDIRLGTLVTSATFRHPSMTAIAVAQVDDISGGRMELGIGTGWYEAEHRAYGLDFGSSFGERFDRLTEQLQIITGLWATPIGEQFDHAGSHYTLAGAPGLPKPIQTDATGTPRVPIIIGGHGPREPRRWQHVSPTSSMSDSPITTSASRNSAGSGPPARPPTGIRDRWSTRSRTWSASGRTKRSSGGGRRTSVGSHRNCGRARSPARSTRSSTTWAHGPAAAFNAATCRCWTWPTSITLRCSVRGCCRPSGSCDLSVRSGWPGPRSPRRRAVCPTRRRR